MPQTGNPVSLITSGSTGLRRALAEHVILPRAQHQPRSRRRFPASLTSNARAAINALP